MKITNPITLDVARSNSYICLLAKQFDENSRFLIATLTNNGKPMIIPAGATVTLRATRPDGEPVAVPGIINNDGTTTVEIDDYILEVVGSASLSIEVAIGDEILTSASFNLTIQRADGNGWLRVYVAAASLAAGNYYITIGDTPYAFTTTQAIPAGGSVYFASEGGTAQTRDASGNVLDASLPVTIASTGTELTSDVPTMSFLAAIAGRMATIEAEMSQKANIDGSYPLLNAGSADNLMTDTGATQAIPFIQEGTGKGNGEATVKAGGVLQLKKKLGNTVGVNQIESNPHFDTTDNWSATNASFSVSGNIGTLVATAQNGRVQTIVPVISGHKYIVSIDVKISSGSVTVAMSGVSAVSTVTNVFQTLRLVWTSDTTGNVYFPRVFDTRASGWDGVQIRNAYIIDLTLWYGSNDRIPSDLLSHPENWGRYYAGSLAYNAGTLESADGTVMRSIGRNLWDEEWEQGQLNPSDGAPMASTTNVRAENFIEIIPGEDYYIYGPVGTVVLVFGYDENYNFVRRLVYNTFNRSFSTDGSMRYIKFTTNSDGVSYGGTYNNDITLSLYYPGESGYDQYYPYSVLAEVDTGSEVLRSAGSVADEKTPDGTITRRVGVVDLGTLTWSYDSTLKYFSSNGIQSLVKVPDTTMLPANISCAKYVREAATYVYNSATSFNKSVGILGTARICISDQSYTDPAVFKTALSGIYLYYELATPTTEQGTAFAENIPCDDFGSLMWTQTKGIPQGNEIFYPTDLKGALESIVAALPSADGIYTLKATISGGVVTYSWS